MSSAAQLNLAPIRNYKIVKMDASGISCVCVHEAGESSKGHNVFSMLNQDEDGITNNDLVAIRELGTLDERVLNVVKDLIMLCLEIRPVVGKIQLDFEDQIMMEAAARLTKLPIEKELHEYEDQTIMAERPLKVESSNFLHDQLKLRTTTCDFDLLPG